MPPNKYPENPGQDICSKYASSGVCPKFDLHGKCSFAHPPDLHALRRLDFELPQSPTASPTKSPSCEESPKSLQSTSFAEVSRQNSLLQKEIARLQRAYDDCKGELEVVSEELRSNTGAQQREKQRQAEQAALDSARQSKQEQVNQVQREELLKIQTRKKVKECEEQWAQKTAEQEEAAAEEREVLVMQVKDAKQRMAELEKETEVLRTAQSNGAEIVSALEAQLKMFRELQIGASQSREQNTEELQAKIQCLEEEKELMRQKRAANERTLQEEVVSLQIGSMITEHRLMEESLENRTAQIKNSRSHRLCATVRSTLISLLRGVMGQAVAQWRSRQFDDKIHQEAQDKARTMIVAHQADANSYCEDIVALKTTLKHTKEQLRQATASGEELSLKLAEAEKQSAKLLDQMEQPKNEANGLREQLLETKKELAASNEKVSRLEAEAVEAAKAHQAEVEAQAHLAQGATKDVERWRVEFKEKADALEQAELKAERGKSAAKGAFDDMCSLQEQLLATESNLEDAKAKLAASESTSNERAEQLALVLEQLAEAVKQTQCSNTQESTPAEDMMATKLAHSTLIIRLIDSHEKEVKHLQTQMEQLRATAAEVPTYQQRINKQNDEIFELQTKLIEVTIPK